MILRSGRRALRLVLTPVFLAHVLASLMGGIGVCAIRYQVTLTDGTVYNDAAVSLDREFMTITLQTDSLTRAVSLSQIASIHNAAGDDVTSDFLGDKRPRVSAPPARLAPTTPTDTSRVLGGAPAIDAASPPPLSTGLDSHRRHPWDAALRWGGNFSIPLGDFYEGIAAGIGFEGDVSLRVARQLAIRAEVSKSGMRDSFEDDFPGYRVARDDLRLTAMRYLIGVAYFDWPHWRSGGRTMYYVYSGLGAVSHSFSGNLILEEESSGEQYVLTSEARDITRFMSVTDFGVVVMLNKSLGLDMSAEFGLVYVGEGEDSGSIYGSVQYAYILDFRLGLVTIF